MNLVVVGGAERHGEFIADFQAQPTGLRVANVVRVRRRAAANRARLAGDEAEVLLLSWHYTASLQALRTSFYHDVGGCGALKICHAAKPYSRLRVAKRPFRVCSHRHAVFVSFKPLPHRVLLFGAQDVHCQGSMAATKLRPRSKGKAGLNLAREVFPQQPEPFRAIAAVENSLPPSAIVQVPAYCLGQSRLERFGCLPAKLMLDL